MPELTIQERSKEANRVIKIVASYGARLLYAEAWDRHAKLGLDKFGQVWLVDSVSGLKMYPFGGGKWHGFTQGHDMQRLINGLAEFVRDGQLVPLTLFGEWEGYSDSDMSKVRAAVQKTGAL